MLIKENYWEEAEFADAICATVNTCVKENGELVMGKGIALSINNKFNVAKLWGRYTTKYKKFGYSSNVLVTPISHELFPALKYLIGIPTKEDWRKPSPVDLVIKSCQELVVIANALGLSCVVFTAPGCGNGGLCWDTVQKQISFLDDRFICIKPLESNK